MPPTATLAEVDIRSELATRPRRLPDHATESRALGELAKELARDPRNMLQRLTEIALELCDADSAGISLLENDVFRWEGLTGVYAPYRHSTMPRAASPCGVCIDQGLTQLMHLPDRCFPALSAEPRFVEALLIPFFGGGEPIGTVWIVAHTDERKFDTEDERIVRTLAEFASAGWQQWKAYEAAVESNQRKDEFLAMLGHELRNPLGAVVSATAILERVGMDPTRLDMVKNAIEVLSRQARQLSRMVDDLNDLARIGQRKLELQIERVELGSVMKDALNAVRSRIERRRHSLSVETPSEPTYLQADATRLTQLVVNLLDNAAKYTPEGGQIWLKAVPGDGAVQLSVRDNGVGIPHEDLDRVFEPFRQLPSVEGRSEGLGLGLALVDSLAKMHGGTVKVSSDGPGKGSEFIVLLPLPTGDRRHVCPACNRQLLHTDGTAVGPDGRVRHVWCHLSPRATDRPAS